MNISNQEPLLKIRFDGEAVGPGRIPVSHLLRFLTSMNKALQRTGRVLLGEAESVRPGRQPDNIKDELALELVLLTHGRVTHNAKDFEGIASLEILSEKKEDTGK